MPLTPTDVQNRQFKVAFRGYSLDEVDAFLDEVESEIGRLLRENDELRTQRVPEPAVPAAAPQPAARPIDSLEGQEAALRTLLLAQRTADEAVAEARAEAAEIVEAARAEADTTLEAARAEAESTLGSARGEAESTLGSARAEADRTLTEARAEAERTVSEAQAFAERTVDQARAEAEAGLTGARAEAESTVAGARAEAEATLGSARGEADATLTSARSEADALLVDARDTATRADAEVAAKVAASLGDLDERRVGLERRIEDLRAFEREYRTRLKAYLQTQLHDLEDRHGPEDSGAGVPDDAPARAAGQLEGEAAPVGGPQTGA